MLLVGPAFPPSLPFWKHHGKPKRSAEWRMPNPRTNTRYRYAPATASRSTPDTMSQYSHLSPPDPQFLDLSSKLPLLATAVPLDVASLRHMMTTRVVPQILQTFGPLLPAESSYRVRNLDLPVDGGTIAIRCIQPIARNDEDSFPLVVWFHGGGWVCGDLDIDDFHLRIISVELRISIVNVDYRLAPEHPFPTGLNDCYAALKWTAVNAAELSGAPAKGFLIGGVSAGAHYAAIVGHRARDDVFFQSTPLTGQILQIPAAVHIAGYPERFKADLLSIEQNKDAPMLNKANCEFFWNCLQATLSDPEASPLILQHEGLAPAYIQVAGLDPLRDEGLLYERLLRESGVKIKLDVYPGVPHGFHRLPLAASKKWETDFRTGLRWLLSGHSADGI
ncbi:alpha/beta hydrolase fold-domain-containing protein [Mycena rosella]|uniref:Alpha/beta hydrolase fold-domain-containing protein n=1 Tax=Mycena rosella TaxID=1033263 RepID=A0AAD7H1W4_MYCRO|nr:alpha/beta hydrolase fold-domain-containing protein [Mycena rosella]